MRTYVVSDIHGEYDLFMKLLEKIHFSDNDLMYVIGDVVDRGPNPVKTLLKMMEYSNIIPLVGNHEVMALRCLKYLMENESEKGNLKHQAKEIEEEIAEEFLTWHINGSITTIVEFDKLSREMQEEVYDYLMEFSVYEVVHAGGKKYLLVHAGLGNYSPERELDDYRLDELVWDRADYGTQYFKDMYVITGHTPTQNIVKNERPGYIYRVNHHIDIDCGACFGGQLGCLCLETDEEFYVSKESSG